MWIRLELRSSLAVISTIHILNTQPWGRIAVSCKGQQHAASGKGVLEEPEKLNSAQNV